MKCQLWKVKCQVWQHECQAWKHKCLSEKHVYPDEFLKRLDGFTLFLAWKHGFTFRQ